MRVGTVEDREIVDLHSAIPRVRLSATCGSDLRFIDGYIPTMKPSDVIGHEFMGVIDDIGPEVKRVANGDRVAIPALIVCDQCWYCQHDLYSLSDNTHLEPELQALLREDIMACGKGGRLPAPCARPQGRAKRRLPCHAPLLAQGRAARLRHVQTEDRRLCARGVRPVKVAVHRKPATQRR
ncbi:alcohol dehydrogenase catalytic domain-containing protein [Paraburkholderia kirstenboschensis]|uniref:Alcohol dehydrogenase catalytic domain-containing protein n=1 Tax=Paraburkholderia kirstenboschensis TaxID=1245436 RepID=A0ABZ0ELG7_9BURK|nr:alcohol dehydrogenase catalytic domain-containing protein [Paraburkholderia kirstenboschensis]WOD17289.1 alcohol dehydrogenase catalytic domain-containing protein [Paraburkholderia kirstenboschensis]